MNKYKLLRLFLSLKKSQEKGISLVELIVALVISGIVLTMAASGFINVLRANQDVESKTVRSASLQRALAFIQEDIKRGSSVESEDCSSVTEVDSVTCLKITIPGSTSISYGLKNISGDDTVFLKPGLLMRKNESGSWEEIMDGLIITEPTPPIPTPSCTTPLNSGPHGEISTGTQLGGFRFCVETNNDRLAQVFLFGYVDSDTTIPVSVITFARSE